MIKIRQRLRRRASFKPLACQAPAARRRTLPVCESQGWVRMSVPKSAWNQVLLSVYGESRLMLDACGAAGGAWVEPSKPGQPRLL